MDIIRNGTSLLEEKDKEAIVHSSRSILPMDLFRYAVALFVILIAQKSLSEWYLYRHNIQLLFFFLQLGGAILIASFPIIKETWKSIPPTRIMITVFILFLVIPWGEILRLNFASARQNWTTQIWNQTIFLFFVLLCFRLFRKVPTFLHHHTVLILDKLASRRFILYLPALLLFGLSSGICLFIYNQTPIVDDSSSYLFQAKIFREGKLYAPVPPIPDFFSYETDMLLMQNGKWFSMYPPGFAMLLALAMLVNAEWYLAPFFGGVTLAIWIEYARRWHGRRIALLFGCLALFSPFIFQMSSQILIHTPELFIASAIIYLCRRQTESLSKVRNILLFLLLCLAMLVRPHSLMVFLTPVLAFSCWATLRRKIFSASAAIISGLAFGFLILSLYQWQTAGHPWTSAYLLEFKGLKYGFGSNYAAQVHTPLRGLELLSNNILGLNRWLTGWYSGSLFFLAAFFITIAVLGVWDYLLLSSTLAILLFYSAYFFQDLIFGPRFFYLLAPFLLLLIARSTGIEAATRTRRSHQVLTATMIVALLSFFPLRFGDFLWIYNPSNDPPEYLTKKVRDLGYPKVLLFLQAHVGQDYVTWNDPFFRDWLIICKDLGNRNSKALAVFPDYQPFYFRFKNISFHASEGDENYGFYKDRDHRELSEMSFFQLALTLQAGNDFPDRDCFDLTYPRLFAMEQASAQLNFLDTQLQQLNLEPNGYRKNFQFGLIHSAKMILIPKLAFEQNPPSWSNSVDLEGFRKELQDSMKFFTASGETGKPLLRQIQKVKARIDQNNDEVLSEAEVLRYLNEKILYLVKY